MFLCIGQYENQYLTYISKIFNLIDFMILNPDISIQWLK